MIGVGSLSEEIASLDKIIESFEGQLNEIRQQREFKMELLRQMKSQDLNAITKSELFEQGTDVVSE
jgi:hypothetical protein